MKKILIATLLSVLLGSAAYAENDYQNEKIHAKCIALADYVYTTGIMIKTEKKDSVEEFMKLILPEVDRNDYHSVIVYKRIEIIASYLYADNKYNNINEVAEYQYQSCVEAHIYGNKSKRK